MKPGDTVEPGDRLVVLEAMKMEMAVTAPLGGRVREVLVLPNVQVSAGAELVVIEQQEGSAAASRSERIRFTPCRGPVDSRAELSQQLLHLVLGYDIDPKEVPRSASVATERWTPSELLDDAAWHADDEVLRILADVLALYATEASTAFERPITAEETLHDYLRGYRAGGKGLPSEFAKRLRRALGHYGVTSLEPTPALEEALLFIHKAHARAEEAMPHAFDILERRLRDVESCRGRASSAQRELLDQLVEATQQAYPRVSDLARELRYQLFDRPLLLGARRDSYAKVREAIGRLSTTPDGADGSTDHGLILDCPHPLLGLLSGPMRDGDEATRRLCLEMMLRRHYRACTLDDPELMEIEGRAVVSARWSSSAGRGHVVATHARLEELSAALASAGPVIARVADSSAVSLELFAVADHEPGAEETERAMRDALRVASYWRPLARISLAVVRPEPGARVRYTTWVPSGGGYVEERARRGIHPMVAQRLELWRLSNFQVELVSASEDILLVHAVAKDNPRDERLMSFVDVWDLTPLRNERGQVTGLPILEHMFLEAIAGIREQQARRPVRERLQWNRVVMFLWPPFDLAPEGMMRVARRLAPAAKGLGLEKAVLRLRMKDPKDGELLERVMLVSNRVGTGMRIRFDTVSDAPVRTLSSYAQKLVQLRRMQLVHPYEIIRMLTPRGVGEQSEFPTGEFVEHDLDESGRLVAVHRAPGNNEANVVVGVIRNVTASHPEGMTRVMLLGDPSREMGALAEPECRRIIAGLDLAERMGVPVEWFAVSSGAKISMDVGTEGLDWVARVLRRIVFFTQAGGEINVVVPGVNVGGQSYWNAEATMLMHTRGILVMTPQGSMVLTGKRALDYSGGVSAETNQGIGGFDRVMGSNGQAQYAARDIADACHILLRHYEHTYVVPGERFPRKRETSDPRERDVSEAPHVDGEHVGFRTIGEVFSTELNPGRKKPFDIRSVMRAVVDRDDAPFERWNAWRHAENAVVWDARLGGNPVCLIGIESKPLPRFGAVPGDGPEGWTGGTLFPQSSKKVARAINGA
ncbi:MAG TPA: carboxyl transferase domain-containing protein, partial [Polyangiaceae bacterium]|nr:carboxyl transferase domain-containing protein [Polyangiaceae bacterium]